MIVKVCGMTQAENIRGVDALGVDLMGFIFYDPSPRCCREVPSFLPTGAERVGVFVDAPLEEIAAKHASFGFDYVQLHGNESPKFCRNVASLGVKLIKAMSVASPEDISLAQDYMDCDLLVFDTRTPLVGGSGKCFDWSLLDAYHGPVPFLLSGGIGPDSVQALRDFSHPFLAGYDLNSRFETAPGVKDIELIGRFIATLK